MPLKAAVATSPKRGRPAAARAGLGAAGPAAASARAATGTPAVRAGRSATAKAEQSRTQRASERAAKLEARRRPSAAPPTTSPLDADVPLTEPEEFSVSPDLMAKYLAEAAEFAAWAQKAPEVAGLSLRDPEQLDQVLVTYLSQLFKEGEEGHVARATFYGVIFKRGLPKLKSTLPRSRRGLAGFDKENPVGSRDPAPEEALFLIIDDLLQFDAQFPGGDILALATAAAAAQQWDLTGRPSETLGLTRDRVIEPQGRKFPKWAVIFHPKPGSLRGKARAKARPSKQGSFDDTIFSGLDDAKNGLCAQQLKVLRQQARPGEPLFSPLTLAQSERYMRRCGLEELEITPHTWRHSSTTYFLIHKPDEFKALMERMRVHCLATARRYGQRGAIQRQVKLMGRERRLLGEALINATKAPENPMHELLCRLSELRKRRVEMGLWGRAMRVAACCVR